MSDDEFEPYEYHPQGFPIAPPVDDPMTRDEADRRAYEARCAFLRDHGIQLPSGAHADDPLEDPVGFLEAYDAARDDATAAEVLDFAAQREPAPLTDEELIRESSAWIAEAERTRRY